MINSIIVCSSIQKYRRIVDEKLRYAIIIVVFGVAFYIMAVRAIREEVTLKQQNTRENVKG